MFLLGYAFIKNGEVVVKQHILPKPGNEVAFYTSFLESVDYHSLVTYNGKAFDWPQVKTQHTLIKEHVPKLPAFGHFDLYHASRRFWKGKLEKVKLASVEKELLQIERVDDLPGYLAPLIYFDFIDRQDPEGLFGILKHNEWDVLSLITLYIHLSQLILEHDKKGNRDEALEIANWLSYVGESNAAKIAYETMIEHDHEKTTSAKFSLSMYNKKMGKMDKAISLWKEIVETSFDQEKIQSLIELAKWYEHKEKNIGKAEHYTMEAVNIVRNTKVFPESKRMKYLNELTIRLGRLNKKK
nr:ribonuclease H-like domain-containing protein [Peribacillus alkalitolerans]